ncbi:MAG: 3-keto-5-aminohexanoate cleavage protein [Gemmatimonadota bacterium]
MPLTRRADKPGRAHTLVLRQDSQLDRARMPPRASRSEVPTTPLPPPLVRYDDVMLNVCPTGPILTKDQTPHVPLQPQEVIDDACGSIEAGASMLHLHARDRAGRPTYRADVYEKLILGVRRHFPDAVLCVSCIGNDFPDLQRRAEVLELTGASRPDMASLATTSFDLPSGANPNPPDVVVALAARMAERGIRPEVECFDSGMVSAAAGLLRRGILRPPLYVNLLLGARTSCPATVRHLAALVADLPAGATWAAAGLGLYQLPMNTLALAMGGHCRVGLEDNIYEDFSRRRLATNQRLVRRLANLAQSFGRPVASPKRARELLGLPAPVRTPGNPGAATGGRDRTGAA